MVSNNNNNRNNNNNNQNNDNNNNNFQTLESSVTGMQMVGRRRRGAAGHTNMTSADDVIMDENTDNITGALYTVMDRFMRAWVKNRLTSERGCHLLHICEANAPPPASAQSPEVVTFAEVATMGLAREVARQSTVEAVEAERYLAAGELGTVILSTSTPITIFIISVCNDELFAGRHRGNCAERYQCAMSETYAMKHLENILYLPSVIHQYIAEK